MLDYDGLFILDVMVEKYENCFLMIFLGKLYNEMLLGEVLIEGVIIGIGVVLV